jgi:hypothetical protein
VIDEMTTISGSGGAEVRTSYTVGLDVIAQQERTRSGSTWKPSDSHTFLYDGHGSTRGLIFQRSFANKFALKTSPDQSL